MSGKKTGMCEKDYLSSSTYAEFLMGRIRSGGIWNAAKRVYGKIRKYTLFTAVLKATVVIVGLLEKSAILLLIFTGIMLMLPILLAVGLIITAISIWRYFRMNASVRPWLDGAEKITVYITSERFYAAGSGKGIGKPTADSMSTELSEMPLFARAAIAEAEEYDHPVIVVCRDPFCAAKWAGFNLLAIKCDYFYILRRYYFKDKNVTCVVLS